ncbi:MAG: Crp/Fnr family transcriptional regulator [Acidimicrobiales bacterium]
MPAIVDLAQLAHFDLLATMEPEDRQTVAKQAKSLTLGRNDIVFAEGDGADDLFLVVSGRVGIVNISMDGRESMVALIEPGDVFGEMALFEGGNRSAQARALEATELIALPYETLREVFSSRPELLWRVVSLLVRRLRATDAALADTVFLDVPGRTAKRLLEIAGDDDEFVVPVTQEELAGLIGASRERVNKAIATFVRLGWMEPKERGYHIVDRNQLRRRST